MKTNTHNKKSGAREQIRTVEQNKTNTPEAQSAPTQPEKKDTTIREANVNSGETKSWRAWGAHRLPIDREARKKNRTLPTPKVLNALFTTLPDAYRVAEVVGKWVWVRFTEQPAAEIRQQLAQLGFHWNSQRQAWQHPCGSFSLGSQADPREKYSSYFPADVKAA